MYPMAKFQDPGRKERGGGGIKGNAGFLRLPRSCDEEVRAEIGSFLGKKKRLATNIVDPS